MPAVGTFSIDQWSSLHADHAVPEGRPVVAEALVEEFEILHDPRELRELHLDLVAHHEHGHDSAVVTPAARQVQHVHRIVQNQ